MCVCERLPHVYGYLQKSEEDMRSPEAIVTGTCELPNMRGKEETNVLCNSSKSFQSPNYLSRPGTRFFKSIFSFEVLSLSSYHYGCSEWIHLHVIIIKRKCINANWRPKTLFIHIHLNKTFGHVKAYRELWRWLLGKLLLHKYEYLSLNIIHIQKCETIQQCTPVARAMCRPQE